MLGFLKNRELRKIFGPKTNEVLGGWKICIMMSFVIYIFK
jgi:acid phosphatase family membrane protein YuiD